MTSNQIQLKNLYNKVYFGSVYYTFYFSLFCFYLTLQEVYNLLDTPFKNLESNDLAHISILTLYFWSPWAVFFPIRTLRMLKRRKQKGFTKKQVFQRLINSCNHILRLTYLIPNLLDAQGFNYASLTLKGALQEYILTVQYLYAMLCKSMF